MDMIDESLTLYESVVGMSVLDQDGVLPVVVVCEVIEEEVDVKSGYRGFSSMEVGLRAVGRMWRWDEAQGGRDISKKTDRVFHGRKVLDDIQIGQFMEYEDDELTDSEVDKCLDYLTRIESVLRLPSQFLTMPTICEESNCEQVLYADAFKYLALQMGDVAAASWAVFALLGDDIKISSIIIQALCTANTTERLRLGLAAVLEFTTISVGDDFNRNDAFQ